jgi:hypothetical protein
MKRALVALLLGVVFFLPARAQSPRTYATNFPLTENPISEGGNWINGQSVGLDWKNVRTTPGLAFGADSSGSPNYNDPTAVLTGSWGPDQSAEGRVRSINQHSGNVYEEIEIRLRTTIAPHSLKGYEINFRCTHDGTQYVEIVRWNGPLGNFSYVARTTGPGLRDGDVVKATIKGSVITAYINGNSVLIGTDGTFPSGSPGIGFYLDGLSGANGDYGFTSFSATDGGGNSPMPPSAPTNLHIVPPPSAGASFGFLHDSFFAD